MSLSWHCGHSLTDEDSCPTSETTEKNSPPISEDMIHQHLVFVLTPTSMLPVPEETWWIIFTEIGSTYMDTIEQQKRMITSRMNGS